MSERFWAKVEVDPSGCWLWTGKTTDGYGYFWDGGLVRAHRWAFEFFGGVIPDGFVLDHVRSRGCLHRNCVNPAHLEPVTQEENVRRGDFDKDHQIHKTACPAGHPYSITNTRLYGPDGRWRRCLECDRQSSQACRDRRKARATALAAGSDSPSAVGDRPAACGGTQGRPVRGSAGAVQVPPTSEARP